MSETQRSTARKIAHKHLDTGDPLGWFEDLYSQADEESSIIPWADLEPNPNLIDWLNQHGTANTGLAIKIGSGLGDDAEEIARRGFETTAFDISESAIAWSQRRFPKSCCDRKKRGVCHNLQGLSLRCCLKSCCRCWKIRVRSRYYCSRRCCPKCR